MNVQFIHAEVYSQVKSQKNKGTGECRRAASDILDEAIRASSFYVHIKNIETPTCLHGLDAAEMQQWSRDFLVSAADQKSAPDKNGKIKKQKTDVGILLVAVASFPGPADQSIAAYLDWKSAATKFFIEKYGRNLVSVLEHTDEANGHLHAIVADDGRPISHLHDGYASNQICKKAKAKDKERRAKYVVAMVKFQDDYHQKVGLASGFSRIGPARQRLARNVYKSQKLQLETNVLDIARIRAREKGISDTEDAVILKLSAAAIRVKTLTKQLDLVRNEYAQKLEILNEMQKNQLNHHFAVANAKKCKM